MNNVFRALASHLLRARREWLVCLLLAAGIAVVYSPVRHYGFVCYDDGRFVADNPNVQCGLNQQSLRYALTSIVAENWHPVTMLSHILDCTLFGVQPGLMHLVNVAFHIANVLLLFLVLKRMTNARWPSALVAAIFGLHPLCVESVAWISERKNVLSFFFFVLTLWAYSRYAERKQGTEATKAPVLDPTRRRSVFDTRTWSAVTWYNISLLFFALGLMSKPMLVTLPFLFLLLDYWPLRRFDLKAPKLNLPASFRLVLEKWRFFALSAICCWVTLWAQSNAGATEGFHRINLTERATNAVTSYLMYVWQLFWPTRLAVLYPHPAQHYPVADSWPSWQVWTAALLLLTVSAFCLCQLRRRPFLAIGWFWYLGTLVPVIGLVQAGEQAMADRYMYGPLVGLILGLTWLASEWGQTSTWRKSSLSALAVAALLGCMALTWRQIGFWRSSVTLFARAVEVTADNPVAQCNLGFGLVMEGQPKLAAVRYRAACAIKPDYTQAHFNLGGLLRDGHYWQQAANEYLAALRSEPNMFLSHVALVQILPHLNRTKEALSHLEAGWRLCPAPPTPNSPLSELMARPMNDLAWALATSGDAGARDGTNSVRVAEQACELTQYKQPQMLGTLAAAYAEAGRYSEAVTTGEMACALAEQAGDAALMKRNHDLVALYKAGQAYHETGAAPEEHHSLKP